MARLRESSKCVLVFVVEYSSRRGWDVVLANVCLTQARGSRLSKIM